MAFGAGEVLFGRLVLEMVSKTDQFVRGLGMAQTQMGGLTGHITKHAGAYRAAGVAITGVGAATLGMVGATVKAAVDFESAFAGVIKTVDGVVDSEGNLTAEGARLQAGIRDLALTIPLTVEELTYLGEVAGQLGVRGTDNILKFIDITAKMGVATNMTSEEAATAMARIAEQTEMPISQVDRLGSTIVALGNNMATTEGEIVAMTLRLTGAGNTIGLTNAEISGMAAALTSVGIRAEMGGSAFSQAMVLMAEAAGEGGDTLSGFADVAGMSAEEFATAFKERPAEAMIMFVEGLKRMRESGENVFSTLEGLEMGERRLRDTMLRLSGSGDLLRESIDLANIAWEENNALQTEAERRFATTASQFTLMWNNVKELAITIGEALLPAVNGLLGMLTPLISSIAGLAKEHQTLTTVLMAGAAAFGALAVVVGPFLVMLPGLVMAIQGLTPVIVAVSGVITGTFIPAVVSATVAAAPWIAAIGAIGIALVELGLVIKEGIKTWQEWRKAAEAEQKAAAAEAEFFRDQEIRGWDEFTGKVMDGTKERIAALKEEASEIKMSADMNVETKNQEISRINELIEGHYQHVLSAARNRGQDTTAIEQEFADRRVDLIRTQETAVVDTVAQGGVEQISEVQEIGSKYLGLAEATTEALGAEAKRREKSLVEILQESADEQLKALKYLAEASGARYEEMGENLEEFSNKVPEVVEPGWKRMLEVTQHYLDLAAEVVQARINDMVAALNKLKQELEDAVGGSWYTEWMDLMAGKAIYTFNAMAEASGVAYAEIHSQLTKLRPELVQFVTEGWPTEWILKALEHFKNASGVTSDAIRNHLEMLKRQYFDLHGEHMQLVDLETQLAMGLHTTFDDLGKWSQTAFGSMAEAARRGVGGVLSELGKLDEALTRAVGRSWYIDAMKGLAQWSGYGFGSMAFSASGGTSVAIGALRSLREEVGWMPNLGSAQMRSLAATPSAPVSAPASTVSGTGGMRNVAVNVHIGSMMGLDPREVGRQVGQAVRNELELELIR